MGVLGGCNAHSTWWDPAGVVAKNEPSPIETPAQRIGKLQRLDPADVARVVDAVMTASERLHQRAATAAPSTVPESR